MDQYTLDVKGMPVPAVGVNPMDADHEAGAVDVTAESGTEAAVRDSIHDAGYDISA
jgi:copper chaperone CopZ